MVTFVVVKTPVKFQFVQKICQHVTQISNFNDTFSIRQKFSGFTRRKITVRKNTGWPKKLHTEKKSLLPQALFCVERKKVLGGISSFFFHFLLYVILGHPVNCLHFHKKFILKTYDQQK